MFNIRQLKPGISLGLLDLEAYSAQRPEATKRDLERAGTRTLLSTMCGDRAVQLTYDNNNKPHLLNREGHISISHSHDKLAIILNAKEETGIDIELIRDKVQRIQHKYLNAGEQERAGGQTEKLITYWAAKECLYKLYGKKEVDFIRHLFIETETDFELVGRIEMAGQIKRYLLSKERIDQYIMVFSHHEIR
ncbi:MAG TPA: 4'-phosphopantetheinyl transferase superfamily protein [Bacteroidia bacterium]|nr:4'-phosphopantetheinyl transferase superfamily protein [Bacteroidia bacterium]